MRAGLVVAACLLSGCVSPVDVTVEEVVTIELRDRGTMDVERPECVGRKSSSGTFDVVSGAVGEPSASEAADAAAAAAMGPRGGERRLGAHEPGRVRFDYYRVGYDDEVYIGSLTVEELTPPRGEGWLAVHDHVCR